MKKIIIITTLIVFVGLFTFIGTDKKIISAYPANETSAPSNITIHSHEMSASQIKKLLLAELQSETTHTSKEPFFFEYNSCSPKLLAYLFIATKDHATARQILESNSKLTPQQLQSLRDHATTCDAMKELEILEGQKISTIAPKLETIVRALDIPQPCSQA